MLVRAMAGQVPWEVTSAWHGLGMQFLLGWMALAQLLQVAIFAYQAWIAPPADRRQTRWVLAASVVATLTSALLLMLPLSGWTVAQVAFENPLLLSLLVPLAVAYLIGRHGYWNVRIYWRRPVVAVLAGGLLATIYGLCLALLEPRLVRAGGRVDPWLPFAAALGVAVLFHPLRERLQRLVDVWLFAAPYNAETILRDFGERLATVTDPDEVARLTLETLESGPQPTAGLFKVRGSDGDYPASVFGSVDPATALALVLDSRGQPLGSLFVGPRPGSGPPFRAAAGGPEPLRAVPVDGGDGAAIAG
jgi:hypothetical protein